MNDLVKYETRGLKFNRKPETLDELRAIIDGLAYFTDNLPWCWGDCANMGMDIFGESFSQLVPDRAAKTLVNWAYVASRIPPGERTFNLSFSHYNEVSGLIHERRNALLAKAEQEGWTVSQLRAAIKGPKAEKPLLECPHCHARLEVRAGIASVKVLPSGEIPDVGGV